MLIGRSHFRIAVWLTMLFLCSNAPLHAQLSASSFIDLYQPASHHKIPAKDGVENLDNFDEVLSKPQECKQLLGYLKTLRVENSAETSQAKARFYYRLANTFARLRLYPLAMKCFLKTIPKQKNIVPTVDSLPQPLTTADTGDDPEKYMAINTADDSLVNYQVKNVSPVKSKVISYQRIHQTFDDGKKAVAYAMLFHVKQPVRGKRKIFVLNNVGHTFITLIKYNIDSTYTSVSFGFYPKKNNLLSATPLIPATASVFKDDSGHEWDEVLGKFISRKRFEKIQSLILQYNGVKYHLSKNNCTDFGIQAAQLAGITINETYGTWPLGQGNNPAVTGQSILQRGFVSTDTGNTTGVFVDFVK